MSEENKKTERMQKLKKYAVFTLMGIICAGSIWLIFAPSDAEKDKQQQGIGFNMEIPAPNGDGIIGDKKAAYENEQMQQRHNEKMKSLESYAFMLGENNTRDDLSLIEESSGEPPASKGQAPQGAVGSSVSAYQDINRTLGSFYENPKTEDYEQEILALEWRIQELEKKIEDKEQAQNAVDEQLALMEKSYELAAKYMPQGQNQLSGVSAEEVKNKITQLGNNSNGKVKITPIKQAREQTVSSLIQEISNEDFIRQYDQPRNMSFHTMDASVGISEKNTVAAVIDNDQTVVDGQSVRLRLTENLMAGNILIPENTIVTGIAKIQGERLDILISSLEHNQSVIPVEMTVYDSDGQKGICIPGSLELDAIKEVVANMGNSMGTSLSITDNAGSQIAADLTRGVIQGGSQYMAKKIRQVKVTLKSGYRLMLLPMQQ